MESGSKKITLILKLNERKLIYSFVFLLLIFVDQATKQKANTVFHNNAFAFSLPLPVWLIYGLYLFFISIMVVYVHRQFKQFIAVDFIAWTLIFSGATSNIAERIIFGYVRDWIYILNGILNLADFYIILGLILLFLKKQNK